MYLCATLCLSFHVSAMQVAVSLPCSSPWHVSSLRPPGESAPLRSRWVREQMYIHKIHCWPTRLLFSLVLDSLNVYSCQSIFDMFTFHRLSPLSQIFPYSYAICMKTNLSSSGLAGRARDEGSLFIAAASVGCCFARDGLSLSSQTCSIGAWKAEQGSLKPWNVTHICWQPQKWAKHHD